MRKKLIISIIGLGILFYSLPVSGAVISRLTSTRSYDALTWSFTEKILFLETCDGEINIARINPQGSGYIQLTNGEYHFADPVYSAGGSSIYYKVIYNAKESIWKMNIDDSQKTMIYESPAGYSIQYFCSSPNNQKIAFIREDPSTITRTLWVMESNGDSLTELTNADISAIILDWAPDSLKLCYIASDLGLRKINIDNTGDAQIVSPMVSFADWSPIGETITYITFVSEDIWIVNTENGETKQLTSDGSINTEKYCLWSPDGQKILYAIDAEGIFVMDKDSTDTSQVASLSSSLYPWYTAWSPNSNGIVFTDKQNLWKVNADGTGLEKITANNLPYECTDFQWSGDGNRIAYLAKFADKYSIYTMDKDGGNKTEVVSDEPDYTGLQLNDWALHSTRFLYTSSLAIYSINYDGTGKKQIASVSWSAPRPIWSPDLIKIAYSDSNEIWTIDANGANTTNLTNTPGIWESTPSWSPGGESITYEKLENIWIMNADGTGQTNLNISGGDKIVWSPDGTKIAYRYYTSDSKLDTEGYWIMDKDGQNKLQLIKTDNPCDGPVWVKDKLCLTISAQIYFINTDGTELKPFTSPEYSVCSPVSSPDNKKLLYAQNGTIWISDFSTSSALSLQAVDNPSDTGGAIKISWNKKKWGIAGYNVYYDTTPFSNINQASYVDTSCASDSRASSLIITELISETMPYYFAVIDIGIFGESNHLVTSIEPVYAINNKVDSTSETEIIKCGFDSLTRVIIPQGIAHGYMIDITTPDNTRTTIVNIANNFLEEASVNPATLISLQGTLRQFQTNTPALGGEVTIVISYPNSISGLLEDNLRIFYLNESTSRWELPSGQQAIDKNAKTISLKVDHFSVYRIFALSQATSDLTKVIVYPNPFRPEIALLKFKGLTAQATIKIYSIAGELVKIIEEIDGNGESEWNGMNEYGEKVASGVYIYMVTNEKGDKPAIGKIAVIR